MTDPQTIYSNTICHLPPSDQLYLASIILQELAKDKKSIEIHTKSTLDILEKLPGSQLFQTSGEANKYLQEEHSSWDH